MIQIGPFESVDVQNATARQMPPRWHLWVVALLSLSCFWLGARGLNWDALWSDEILSIYDAAAWVYGPGSPAEIIERISEQNPWHAPGFFIGLNLWTRIAGSSIIALRGFALLGGVLAVPLLYRVGARYLSPNAGLYGALILGTSPMFIYYLHEVRMYAPVMSLTVVFLGSYLSLTEHRRPFTNATFFLSGVALLYSHYMAGLVVVAFLIFHVFMARRGSRWQHILSLLLLALLAFTPWLSVLASGLDRAQTTEELHARALSALPLIGLTGVIFAYGSWPLLLTTLAGFADSIKSVRKYPRFSTILIIAGVLFALIVAVNQLVHVIHGGRLRYTLVLYPFFALFVALAIENLIKAVSPIRRIVGKLLLAAWLLIGLFGSYWPHTLVRAGWVMPESVVYPLHRVASVLRSQVEPADLIIYAVPEHYSPWMRHKNDTIAAFYFEGVQVDQFTLPYEENLDHLQQSVDYVVNLASIHQRIWLAYMPGYESSFLIRLEEQLTKHFGRCGAILDGDDIVVETFLLEGSPCPQST